MYRLETLYANRERLIVNFLIATYAVTLFAYAHYQAITNRYWINDDWPQHLLWLYKFHPNFFQPNDYYLQTSEAIQPWGIYLINTVFGSLVPPLWLSKLFPLIALWAICWFSFHICKKRFGLLMALAAMVMLSNVPFERMAGFFARAYAFPLLLAFMYYVLEEKKRGILVVLILSTLTYPIVFLIQGVILGIQIVVEMLYKSRRKTGNWYFSLLTVLLLCIGVLLLKSHTIDNNPLLGGFLTKKELLSLPEFGSGGRVPFQYNMDTTLPVDFPWRQYFTFPVADWDQATVGALLLLLLTILMLGKSRFFRFDMYVLSLPVAGVLLFYLAQWRLPQLFLPSRYLYYCYIPFLLLLVFRMFTLLHAQLGRSLISGLTCCTILAIATFQARSPKDIGLYGYDDQQALYETINQFQTPVLIAGPPLITSQIPTFCQQSVLFSHEAVHAMYFRNYYDYTTPRVEDFVTAYCTTERTVLANFLLKYDIDFLIVDRVFTTSKNMWFYQPYRDSIREKTDTLEATDLVLAQCAPEFLIAVNERYDLLDCKKWLNDC